MKLRLSILSCLFVLLAASANGQNSLDADIHNLQKQIQRWEAIVRENVKTADNNLNISRLATKKTELLEAVTTRIAQLGSVGDTNGERYGELMAIRNRLVTSLARTSQNYQSSVNTVRPRAVTSVRSGGGSEVVTPARGVSRSARLTPAPITLDAMTVGDSMIQGTSSATVSEVVVEIRSADSRRTQNSPMNLRYSHSLELSTTASVQRYRVARYPASNTTGGWRFAVKLSGPLALNREVRTIPNGNLEAASPWIRPGAGRALGTMEIASATAVPVVTGNELQRFNQAIHVVTDPNQPGYPTRPPVDLERCTTPSHNSYYTVFLDWRNGNASPPHVNHNGLYCFKLTQANTVLYTYSFNVTETAPPNTPLGILADSVTAIRGVIPAPPAKAPSFATLAEQNCQALSDEIAKVKEKATALDEALALLEPGKKGEKVESVSLETTLHAWAPVPGKFDDFEREIDALRTLMNDTTSAGYDSTCGDIKTANDLILINYRNARKAFLALDALVNSSHVVAYPYEVDSSNAYEIDVDEFYNGQSTNAATKKYRLGAGYVAITSSAGFMITKLAARSYSAVAAPNPADPTTTQTVLNVDYGAGARVALTALLNYNLPFATRKDFGAALAVGPVFDISAGKADTSRFGLFGGVGIRLKQLMYITPGVHIGEFADFPQGFTRSGQVVPANFATPTPVKRWTTRFALAITFKVKDLWTPSQSSETGGKENK